MPRAAVIIVTFNSQAYIGRCLKSLRAQDPLVPIFVIDNHSQDQTQAIVGQYPQVRFLALGENRGYARAINIALAQVFPHFSVAVVINPDVTVRTNWLKPLVAALDDQKVGLAQPRILLERGQAINTLGTEITWLGLSYPIGYQEPPQAASPDELAAVSGACFAINRSLYEAVGGLDEEIFLYTEDTEYSWRARLAGFILRRADQSIVCHHYRFTLSRARLEHLELGRLWLLLTLLKTKSLVVLAPLLILGEIALALRFPRLSRPKLYRQLWQKRAALGDKRRQVARWRQTGDGELLAQHSPTINYPPLRSGAVTSFNLASLLYCRLAQQVI